MGSSSSTGPRHARSTNVSEHAAPVVIPDPRSDRDAAAAHERKARRDEREGQQPLVEEHRIKPAKTSTAAVFSLVVGLTALYAVLTILLSPFGLVLSIVGLLLGYFGIRATRKMGVTGKGVAAAGIVLSLVALVGSILIAAGVTFFLNDDEAVQRFENGVENIRDDLPEDVDVPQP